ncbi:hypothetical protein [Nonomuraea salmonea]|uniref:hypothetical protein n=1 Tax=Nonomuraea salmonea TaxID=46181 RepID=UPI0031E8264F
MPFAPSFPVMLRTEDGVRIDAAHTPLSAPISASSWRTASPARGGSAAPAASSTC